MVARQTAPPPPPAAAPVASTASAKPRVARKPKTKPRTKSAPVAAPVAQEVEKAQAAGVAGSRVDKGYRTKQNELVDPISGVRYFPNRTVCGEHTHWVDNQLTAGILREMGGA